MKPDYEETVLKYKSTVYKIAFAQCDCREDADDVFQEVFLKLLSCRKDFENDEHLKAWLIRVTINCCKRLHRSIWSKNKTELTEDIAYGEFNEDCDSERNAVIAAVKRLPEKYRPPVIMFYYEELPCRSIANILKMNEATVRTRLRRARKLLKNDLKDIWLDD